MKKTHSREVNDGCTNNSLSFYTFWVLDLVTLIMFFCVVCEVKCAYVPYSSLKPRKLNLKELKKKNRTEQNQANKPRKCRKISIFQVNSLLSYCIGPTGVEKRIGKV